MKNRLFLFIVISLIQSCQSSINRQLKNTDIKYISRPKWNASNPALPMEKHIPLYITIHHTATFQNNHPIQNKLLALQKFSKSEEPLADGTLKKAWADIPYHFYIDAEGTIAEGREIMYVGDSNTNYKLNGHILIVLEGNFNEEEVTVEQYISLEYLVLIVAKKWNIKEEFIFGHKDQANTSCPGSNLYPLMPLLRSRLSST